VPRHRLAAQGVDACKKMAVAVVTLPHGGIC
jgi:hypothetical protein